MIPLVVLLLATPMQTRAQRFPVFDPEQIFMMGDADLDGRLSLDEYRDFLRSSPRMKGAAATIEPMFRRLDADRDGFLSLAEYRKSFPRRPAGTPPKSDAAKEKPAGSTAPEGGITAEQEQFFEAKVRPVLVAHCGKCHASTAEKLRGGLRLDSREGLRKGGDSGPAIIPGRPDESLLLRAIGYRDEDLQMPPKGKLPGRGHRGFRGLDQDGRSRPADRAGAGARGAPVRRSCEGPGVLVVPASEKVQPARGEAHRLAARRNRPLPARGA